MVPFLLKVLQALFLHFHNIQQQLLYWGFLQFFSQVLIFEFENLTILFQVSPQCYQKNRKDACLSLENMQAFFQLCLHQSLYGWIRSALVLMCHLAFLLILVPIIFYIDCL